jgi:hypothetical protein
MPTQKTPTRVGGLTRRTGRRNIDAVVALAMALERAEHPAPTVELVGWL